MLDDWKFAIAKGETISGCQYVMSTGVMLIQE